MRGALRFPWKNILTNFREVVCYWVTDGEGRAQEAVGSLREVPLFGSLEYLGTYLGDKLSYKESTLI